MKGCFGVVYVSFWFHGVDDCPCIIVSFLWLCVAAGLVCCVVSGCGGDVLVCLPDGCGRPALCDVVLWW